MYKGICYVKKRDLSYENVLMAALSAFLMKVCDIVESVVDCLALREDTMRK